MVRRTARAGPRAGQEFWGCSTYPSCRTIVNIDESPGDGHDPLAPKPAFRRRQAWSDYGTRPSWTSFYAPAGGRIRAWDALTDHGLGDAWTRAMSQAAFYVTGSGPSSEPESVVVDVMRRLLTRG